MLSDTLREMMSVMGVQLLRLRQQQVRRKYRSMHLKLARGLAPVLGSAQAQELALANRLTSWAQV